MVYRSYGFWLRESTYREQPTVAFKKEFMLLLDVQSQSSGTFETISYSTFQQFNQLIGSQIRIPVTKVREDDVNNDGKSDRLILNIAVPMTPGDHVVGAKLLLFFYYKLTRYSKFHMESLGYIEYDSPIPGAQLDVFADLTLNQNQLLRDKGLDTRYNGSLVNRTSFFASDYSLSNILKTYKDRNITTILEDTKNVWIGGRAADFPFVISAMINYPEQQIIYSTGFWYMIKWGWVQYASFLVVFMYLFDKMKVFVFQQQMVPSVVQSSTSSDNKKVY